MNDLWILTHETSDIPYKKVECLEKTNDRQPERLWYFVKAYLS